MIYLELLFFTLLIFAGLFCLVKVFMGQKILQTSAELKSHELIIEKSGFYSLWVKGKLFKKIGIDIRTVRIFDSEGNKKRSLPSMFNPQSNGTSEGTLMLKYYYLKEGSYKFVVREGKELRLNLLENLVTSVLSKTKEPNHTYILKRTFPEFIVLLSLPIILFSVMQIITVIQELII
jgi:hypothetical protein